MSDLGWQRTWLALERTLMSWVRTSASLVAFGFAIYKFFELETVQAVHRQMQIGPRTFALIMIALGVLSCAAAIVQHHLNVRRWQPAGEGRPLSIATALAACFAIVGVIAFVAVALRA